ncbi:MAG: transcriptional repressor LexA [Sulfurimicrobium sp.]|nr:transcriptional repressor LexA [Sulfurimicrobium sp.]
MYSTNSLTTRQGEMLNFLKEFQSKEGMAPTYREIAAHFRFKSIKAASDHISALEKKGYVRRRGGRSRGIELLPSQNGMYAAAFSIPVLGNIPAGYPEEQIEKVHGMIAVDQMVLGLTKGHRLFAVKVEGESMEGRGIYKGDWVVGDADDSPREGNIVVALIDGQNTLKTLARKNESFFLKAENPDYSDLIPITEMVIQGTVKAVLRRVS